MPYQIECTQCGFVKQAADLESVLECEREHKEKYGRRHFYEFEMVEA